MLNIYTQHNEKLPEDKEAKKPDGKFLAGDYLKYKDPTGEFQGNELRMGIWYVKHRLILFKILVTSLIVFSVIVWGYGLWGWLDYLVLGSAQDRQVMMQLTQLAENVDLAHFAPLPLRVADTLMLEGGVKKYDAVAQLINDNKDFVVEFDYHFVVAGDNTAPGKGFLLPGETKLIATLGLADVGSVGAPDLVIANIKWQRISRHQISDPLAWQKEHSDFTVSDFKIYGPATIEGVQANILNFNLTNNSPYGYQAPSFLVGLYQGGSLTGVMPLQLDSLKSLETKSIDLRSFVPNLNVAEVQLYPEINVYDQEAYLPPAS